MAASEWIGGGNNKANNPNDWSPAGLPQANVGLLAMNSGTIDFSHYSLPLGDYLGVNGSPQTTGNEIINLSHGSSVTAVAYADQPQFNIKGTNTLILGSAYTASPEVNLAKHAEWKGNFNVDYTSANLTVNGGKGALFINDFLDPKQPVSVGRREYR